MKNKILFFFIILIGFSLRSSGQTIGNEWINYSQKYFRIDVVKDSMYRLEYDTLANVLNRAGISVATINPKRFQVFGRGVEIALYVSGEADNSFDPGDYIEFYARANDGWLDTRLYADSINQANPYYSLFNDTASYYFTYNNLTNNKRMSVENGTNFSTYGEVPYFLKRYVINFNSRYYLGSLDEHGVSASEYIEAEGWASERFYSGYSEPYYMPTFNPYLAGPATDMEVGIVGCSGTKHHLQIVFPGQTFDSIYSGYPIVRARTSVLNTLLTNGNTPITIKSLQESADAGNTQAITFIKLTYPHTLALENSPSYKLFLPVFGALPKAVLKVNTSSIASGAGDSPLFYDLTNNIRITPQSTGAQQFSCLVNNIGSTKEIYLTSEQKIAKIAKLTPVNGTANFTNFGAEPYLSSDYIIVTHKSLMAEAEQYKTYREQSGYPELYTPMIADIDELYDQFAYGIRKNPLAIRNLVRFATINFHQTPKNLFIIGKSYRAGENSTAMSIYRRTTWCYDATLVPTFGVPPSDNLFSTGLINPNEYSMAIPTGRLSAKIPEHVTLYLNKVMEYENALRTPQPWMKNVLHFAGGTGSLHTMIVNFMQEFENIIEDTLFGGHVRTIEKTSTEPIQINQSDSLKTIINNGVSVMTFYGHAAGVGFDISIDNPEEYNNFGKYPFLIGLSCFAGDLYTTGAGWDRGSSSEQFVLIANKGTIAYLASVSTAVDSYLYQYTNEFYKNFGQRHYGKSIGYNIQQTVNSFAGLPVMKETCMDMTFHGDPAIVLNSFEKPDYVIQPSDISFNPTSITTELDSMTVNVQLRNIGRAINDSIIIRVRRTFPDNSFDDYLYYQRAPYYIDLLNVKMPVNRVKGVGNNQITVTLDLFGEVDEISETNNTTTVPFSVISSDIIPVYPPKYAVIDSNKVTLIASTGSPFLPATSFTIEVDSTDTFNSPMKLSTAIVSPGGIVQWSLPITLRDSMVYYWRIAETGDTLWRESSFQYIHGKKGWGQAHFFQFKNDQYQLVNFNRPLRKFDFIQEVKSLKAQTGFWYPGSTTFSWTEVWYKINGSIMDQWTCLKGADGIKIAVINPVSGNVWVNQDSARRFTSNYSGLMGQVFCDNDTNNRYLGFDFHTSDSISKERLATFIDSIPNGYYVLAMSLQHTLASTYNQHLKSAFISIGSKSIVHLQDNLPYLIFGKKGIDTNYVGDTVVEKVALSPNDIISISKEFRTSWDEGTITSELIGPASSWGSAHWRINNIEPADSVSVQIIGVSALGQETILFYYSPGTIQDVYNLGNLISAQQYPYLRLKLITKDKVNNTPVQIKSWHVLYEPVPETAIDPVSYFHFYNTPIQEGDSIRFGIATHNISNIDMDSLLVTYRIIRNNLPVWTKTKRLRPHPAGDVIKDSVAAPTLGLQGFNTIQVEFNPNDDQPEQTHFNNIAEVNFNVSGDRVNPMMDVTFDGVRIMNGDLVSSKPTIQITLKDENRFLLMNTLADTSQFRIRIKSPKDADFVSVPFFSNGVQIMQFVPATATNKCHVIYKGEFPTDGQYQLEVEAMDKSNNLSGVNKYIIYFEVQNKSTITDVMNWPNPFSTATHFVFTLTGSELPTYFKIQIMTITGKLVREIDLTELGTIHIGRNITDYAWDGKDQFGDQLANGIYLYRVVTNIKGENIEKSESGASKYFTKEFGKMCLIR
jgi:hypothetical protein